MSRLTVVAHTVNILATILSTYVVRALISSIINNCGKILNYLHEISFALLSKIFSIAPELARELSNFQKKMISSYTGWKKTKIKISQFAKIAKYSSSIDFTEKSSRGDV